MRKVKIVFDREKCLGDCTCANLNPELWRMDPDDAKAVLKSSKEENGKFVLETDLDLYLQMAAEQCPARIIEVFDVDGEEKLF